MDWILFWTVYAQLLIATTLSLPLAFVLYITTSAVVSAKRTANNRATKIQ